MAMHAAMALGTISDIAFSSVWGRGKMVRPRKRAPVFISLIV